MGVDTYPGVANPTRSSAISDPLEANFVSLSSKGLDMRAGKWDKSVVLQKVEDALAKQVCNDANMVAEVETVSEMDATVSIVLVIVSKRRKNPQLDP